MEHSDTTEPVPRERRYKQLMEFMLRMQQTVDMNVRALRAPLGSLSEVQLRELVERLNRYLEFELISEEIEGDVPVCVSGSGVMIATDRSGRALGSEVISAQDIVIGSVSSMLVRPVPTLQAVVEAQALGSTEYGDDIIMSVAAIVEDGMFYVGLDENGNPSNQHDLSRLDIQLALAYPLRFNPITVATPQ